MESILTVFGAKGTFAHGVHPPERKEFSENAAIEVLPTPLNVVLPLSQHLGAPSKAIVESKQKILANTIVAESGGFVSVPLHSPIAGVVQKFTTVKLPSGIKTTAIPVIAEGNQLEGQSLFDEILGGNWPLDEIEQYSSKEIIDAIVAAGIVGMGGAAFPTHVKVTLNEEKPVHTLLINGCECEPYLTCDYQLMLKTPMPIIAGALLAARSLGVKNIAIGVEANKPKAIQTLKGAAKGTPVQIVTLKTKYPQGAEKSLIKAITNLEVPLGGLPADIGVVVQNVGTATAIARAVLRKKPLTHRIISVTGGGIHTPKNILAPIGASYQDLIDFCGGLKSDTIRVVSGGPMMGFAFTDLSTPVTKGTSGITVYTAQEVKRANETACIRCGQCVDHCPMRLVPTKLAMAGRYENIDVIKRYNVMGCFECGSCAYICPAKIPLVQLIRSAKTLLHKAN